MSTGAYSGVLMRTARERYAQRPAPPGVNQDHFTPSPEPDPFTPVPETPDGQTGDVWAPDEIPGITGMRDQRIHHWSALQPPVPTNVPSETRAIAWQARMIKNHSIVRYRPDQNNGYRNGGESRSIEYVTGPLPWQSGDTAPAEMKSVTAGKNAYDFTNETTDVYSADAGRYRLGVTQHQFASYEQPGKMGQDAELHAYTGLSPQFPVDKDRLVDSSPYTPNSRGAARWGMPSWNDLRMNTLGTETAVSDYKSLADDETEISVWRESSQW
jgi:hypothetical protein